jgi:hypothetical protein
MMMMMMMMISPFGHKGDYNQCVDLLRGPPALNEDVPTSHRGFVKTYVFTDAVDVNTSQNPEEGAPSPS